MRNAGATTATAGKGNCTNPAATWRSARFCGGQLIACGCCYDYLGIRDQRYGVATAFPPAVYNNGLTPQLEERWRDILHRRGRVPYVVYPYFCARCGQPYPELFAVPDEEWERNVDPRHQRSVFCLDGYQFVKGAAERARKEEP